MSDAEKALELLSVAPIRYSYLIARLDSPDSNVRVYIEDETNAVLIKRDETITMMGKESSVVELLEELEPGEYRFHAVEPVAFRAAERILYDIDDRPTWMLKRPPEALGEPMTEVEPLNEDDAEVINKYWGLGDRDSYDYIASRIRDGPAFGISRNGELVAWSLTHYITDKAAAFGFLHVKEGWRRKGFAKSITEALHKEVLKKGLIPVIDVFKDNHPSLKLSQSLGFVEIGENHWFSASK